jgi:starch-binding outer membrane protein, SusD/RagB family
MKTNNILRLLFVGIGASALTSCTDLAVTGTDSIIDTKKADGTVVLTNPAARLESSYKDLGAYTDQANIYALGQHTSAEMIPPTRGVDWGDNGVWRILDQHTWDAANGFVLSTWNDLNQRVYRANEILSASPTPAQAAQAKFLLAYNMFHVMDYYGKAPFRLTTEGSGTNPKVYSRSEAFDFIVKNLEEALPGLTDIKPSANNATASKAAANALLARLFLNKAVYKSATPQGPYTFDKADMDKVIQYADAVAASGYSLEKNYFDNFTTNAKTEVIFVTNEGSPQNRWYMTLHYDQNPSGWNGFTTLADFYDKFDKTDSRIGVPARGNGTKFSGIGRGFLIGQQIDDNGKAMVDSRSQKPLAFTRDVPLAGAATEKGIRVIKYHPADAGKYILLRYAEVYLAKAEAQLRGGNTAGALASINTLRAARGAAALGSLTTDALFDEIGRETYWEGGKRTHEIRFGKFLTGTGATVSDPKTVLFPIPSSALISNPNLSQNPGY